MKHIHVVDQPVVSTPIPAVDSTSHFCVLEGNGLGGNVGSEIFDPTFTIVDQQSTAGEFQVNVGEIICPLEGLWYWEIEGFWPTKPGVSGTEGHAYGEWQGYVDANGSSYTASLRGIPFIQTGSYYSPASVEMSGLVAVQEWSPPMSIYVSFGPYFYDAPPTTDPTPSAYAYVDVDAYASDPLQTYNTGGAWVPVVDTSYDGYTNSGLTYGLERTATGFVATQEITLIGFSTQKYYNGSGSGTYGVGLNGAEPTVFSNPDFDTWAPPPGVYPAGTTFDYWAKTTSTPYAMAATSTMVIEAISGPGVISVDTQGNTSSPVDYLDIPDLGVWYKADQAYEQVNPFNDGFGIWADLTTSGFVLTKDVYVDAFTVSNYLSSADNHYGALMVNGAIPSGPGHKTPASGFYPSGTTFDLWGYRGETSTNNQSEPYAVVEIGDWSVPSNQSEWTITMKIVRVGGLNEAPSLIPM